MLTFDVRRCMVRRSDCWCVLIRNFGGKAMADGLITSFFATVSRTAPATEKKRSFEDVSCNDVSRNGLTVDMGGLLHSGGDETKTKKKKKRSRRGKGHVHLAELSEGDNCISLGDEEGVKVCEEMMIMDPDESIVWLSPLKKGTALSSSWKQVFCQSKKSPKRSCSPRQPSPRKQAQRSPLKHTVKRQLLSSPSATSVSNLVDHAPYTHLVHVLQDDKSTIFERQTPRSTASLPMKIVSQGLLHKTEVGQSLGVSMHQPLPFTTPSFQPVADRLAYFHQLEREHSNLNISDIYSRYCSLTTQDQQYVDSSSLTCHIAVNVDKCGITVDHSVYPKQVVLQNHVHSDLWSEIYRPRRSSEMIGNRQQCTRLCTWLRKWEKERAIPEAGKKETRCVPLQCSKHRKVEGGWANDSDDDFMPPSQLMGLKRKGGLAQKYLESDSDVEADEEENLNPVMLVYGPTGSGKTAAIYACAEELGFGVRLDNIVSQI